ncbi:MAG: hypothetical protein ACHQ49_12860 [Elusimicrobiota bacterium]
MKRLSLLLTIALALPGRAAVVERASFDAALPSLPASAVVAAPALSAAPAFSASPSFSAPSFSAPAPLPASPAAAAAAAEAASALTPAARARQVEGLQRTFSELDALYPLPDSSPAAKVRRRIRADLLSSARELADPEILILETVARESDRALARIQLRLDAGDIDPNRARTLRLAETDPESAEDGDVHMRIAVYPVAADPFQWGHLLIALRAVGDLGVDKIVFVLQGDDPVRKPTMTPTDQRHPMGLEVLSLFAPFFAYSPISVGTSHDGETNIFRILALNRGRRVDAWYMVGDDHYGLVDKRGNPDTLPKLESNFASPDMGHSPTLHALKVAFIKREKPEETEAVATSLDVLFLDHVGFAASSTDVRGGRHSLMPFAAFDYARRAGLYGVAPKPEEAKPDGE